MRELPVRPFVVGQCSHPQAMTIRGGRLQPVPFPALATLIVHPQEGPVLFDTGYDPAFLAATQPFPERLYRWLTPMALRPGEELAQQLRRIGIEPADVRHVILSHFHADHIAGLHAFPGARIHCAKAGLRSACQGSRAARLQQGILRALLPADIRGRARFFEEAPPAALPRALAPFETGADLIGDGSILAVELPGHCPGHWGVLVNDAQAGLHFLVADAAWSSEAIRRNAPPPALVGSFLGNGARGRETLARLHGLWRRNPDLCITPSHCPERAADAGWS